MSPLGFAEISAVHGLKRSLSAAINQANHHPTMHSLNPVRWIVLLLVGISAVNQLQASTYWVNQAVAASGNGLSQAAAFKTIQEAATAMAAAPGGHTCNIMAGTYRETVNVTRSGASGAELIFQAYNPTPGNPATLHSVTVSGTNPVTGWLLESTNVWYVGMTGSLIAGNQVFQSGVMKPEARWPNAGALFPWQDSSLAHPTYNELGNWSYINSASYTINATNATSGTFLDPQLPNRTDDYWNGATIRIMSGAGWLMAHPTVTDYVNSSRTVITDHAVNFNTGTTTPSSAYAMTGGNEYYITGKKGEMDTAGEWFYQEAQTTPVVLPERLYFYSASAPTGVEVKKRNYGFNLNARSYIKLVSLRFHACTVQTDTGSSFLTYDGLYMRFLGHSRGNSTVFGIDLRNNSTLRNSDLGFDSQGLVRIRGSNVKVINNNLHDSGYVPNWTAMVDAGINTPSSLAYKTNLISRNTFRDSGRSLMGFPGQGSIVEYNDMVNAMRLTTDGGVFYSNFDGGNNIVRYNLMHDSMGPAGHGGAPVFGFYLDSQNSNWIVHHNMIWNIGGWVMHINARTNFNKVFNNTCWNTAGTYGSTNSSFNGDGETGSSFFNNIFYGAPVGNQVTWAATDVRFNYYGNPGFVSAAFPFLLQSGSAATNTGTVIPGVTTGYVTAPDIGAQEYGTADWTPQAGYHTTPPAEPTFSVPEVVFVNKVKDESFESGIFGAPNWTSVAGGNVVFQAGHSWSDVRLRTGGFSLKFGQGTSEVRHTVTGLQADRRYKLYAGFQTSDATASIKLGVRNQGYSALEIDIPGGTGGVWEMQTFSFVTGTASTTAEIYIRVVSTSATVPVYVDDVAVVRMQEPAPASVKSPMIDYTFNQSSGTAVTDSSIFSRHGTVTGAAAPLWQAGHNGNALGFDGVDDYVQTPAVATPTAITVACWAKSNTTTWNAYGCLVAQRPSFVLHPEQGSRNVRFMIYDTPTTAVSLTWAAPGSFDITQWHHYAGVFNPATDRMEFYVDGVYATGITTTATMNPDTGAVMIGKDDYTGRFFNGLLDDVRIYDRALTAAELDEMFLTESAEKMHLTLDESAGAAKAWDSTGNARTATLSNFATATAWGPGVVGDALTFDGVNDIATSPSSIPTTTNASFTVSTWVKFDGSVTNPNYPTLLRNSSSEWLTNGWMIKVARVNAETNFSLYTYMWDAALVSPGTVSFGSVAPGQWTHIAFVVDRDPATGVGTAKGYRDGVLTSTVNITSTFGNVNNGLQTVIGSGTFRGQLDDVRTWTRALSWPEIMELSERFNAAPYY
jgi:hypothetical protein